jgi:6-phosphofructokinase 1
MILEVMGRHAGWISLYSGLAGGADMILIPEIPFRHDLVVDFFKHKYAMGQTYGLIVVSEGATDESGKVLYKDLGSKSSEMKLGGVGEHIEVLLNFEPELESRCTVLGHLQRGGTPNSWDRILSRSFGAYAGRMVKERKYGEMVGYVNGSFTSSPITECLKQLKLVNPKGDFVERARELGVSFGDR